MSITENRDINKHNVLAQCVSCSINQSINQSIKKITTYKSDQWCCPAGG